MISYFKQVKEFEKRDKPLFDFLVVGYSVVWCVIGFILGLLL